MHPSVFGIQANSSVMSDAMDIARGGQFFNVPNNYPEEAWYHYDDWTCDYECMAIEYMYWCIVSNMGLLDNTWICSNIDNEWELCTPELFESTDVMMYDLLTDPEYLIPQLAPDGNYCPNSMVPGDINGDASVNIQDVILAINLILGMEYNLLADLNSDGDVNVIDVVLLVNLILDV